MSRLTFAELDEIETRRDPNDIPLLTREIRQQANDMMALVGHLLRSSGLEDELKKLRERVDSLSRPRCLQNCVQDGGER